MATILLVWPLRTSEYSVLGVSVPVNGTSLSQWPKLCLLSWLHSNPHFCFLHAWVCLVCAEDTCNEAEKKKSVKPGGCGMNRTVTMARQMSTQEQNTGGYFDKSSNWDQQTATNTTEFHTCQITRVLWGNWCGWKEYEPGNQNDEPEVSVFHFTGDVIWLLGPSKLVPFPQRGNNCSTLLEVGVIKAWSSVVIEPDHLMLPVEKLRLKAR